MEQNKVDLFIATFGSKFPSQKLILIKTQLEKLDDSKFMLVQSIEYKDPTIILIVSILIGGLGIDRFMLGQVGMGIGKLLTLGGLGIWTIIDWFTIRDAAKEINYQKFAALTGMDTSAENIEQRENQRPTFITVLCILSFVGIAFSLIIGIKNYFEFNYLAAAGDMLGDLKTAGGEQMGQAMNQMADAMGLNFDYSKMALSALVVALLNIPILFGVLMMWKQKKMGFYVYAVFELIQCVMPFVLVGGLVAGLMGSVMAIVAIVFIVLYGLNLKHMS